MAGYYSDSICKACKYNVSIEDEQLNKHNPSQTTPIIKYSK